MFKEKIKLSRLSLILMAEGTKALLTKRKENRNKQKVTWKSAPKMHRYILKHNDSQTVILVITHRCGKLNFAAR